MEDVEALDELEGYDGSLVEEIQEEEDILYKVEDEQCCHQKGNESIEHLFLGFTPESSIPGAGLLSRRI